MASGPGTKSRCCALVRHTMGARRRKMSIFVLHKFCMFLSFLHVLICWDWQSFVVVGRKDDIYRVCDCGCFLFGLFMTFTDFSRSYRTCVRYVIVVFERGGWHIRFSALSLLRCERKESWNLEQSPHPLFFWVDCATVACVIFVLRIPDRDHGAATTRTLTVFVWLWIKHANFSIWNL